jgi:TP901-1 family phage major tail protein
MAKLAGRNVAIYSGDVATGTRIAGMRSETISINNEPIDISDKGSAGWRELMADAAMRSVDMSGEGLFDGQSQLQAAVGDPAGLRGTYTLLVAGVGSFAGLFHLSSVELGAPHEEAATFTLSLASAGVIAFTAV